jgi:hypothetical protein
MATFLCSTPCPLLAQSGHGTLTKCPLLGVKQTSPAGYSMSAFAGHSTDGSLVHFTQLAFTELSLIV